MKLLKITSFNICHIQRLSAANKFATRLSSFLMINEIISIGGQEEGQATRQIQISTACFLSHSQVKIGGTIGSFHSDRLLFHHSRGS